MMRGEAGKGGHAESTSPASVREGREVEILAQALWAEAGNRPVRAIEALASVVANRARLAAVEQAARLRFAPDAGLARAAPGTRPPPWSSLLGAVCRAPFFFRCWRDGGAARRGEAIAGCPGMPEDASVIEACRRIAGRAASGALPDPTGGATHWHDAGELPGWAIGLLPTALVAGLVFYRA